MEIPVFIEPVIGNRYRVIGAGRLSVGLTVSPHQPVPLDREPTLRQPALPALLLVAGHAIARPPKTTLPARVETAGAARPFVYW